MAREHFETAQHLANSLLSPAHALRLSVALEHAAFIWDCEKEHERAQKIARRTIREVYSSTEELDDEEFADASGLVQALGGIVKRGPSNDSMRQSSSREELGSPRPRENNRPPQIDRTIAVSPGERRNNHKTQSPIQRGSILRTPERLSTVPEVESTEATSDAQTLAALSPPVSRLSSRSKNGGQRRTSSASDKAAKRRAVEQAEELYRRNSAGGKSNVSSGSHSRQATPPEGYVRPARGSKHRRGGNGNG